MLAGASTIVADWIDVVESACDGLQINLGRDKAFLVEQGAGKHGLKGVNNACASSTYSRIRICLARLNTL